MNQQIDYRQVGPLVSDLLNETPTYWERQDVRLSEWRHVIHHIGGADKKSGELWALPLRPRATTHKKRGVSGRELSFVNSIIGVIEDTARFEGILTIGGELLQGSKEG